MELNNRTIYQGDVIEQLKLFPDASIDTVIDSPPYWGLRDYGIEGQWGLEDDFHDYLDKLQLMMNELKRIIKPTGSVWINLGDTYGGGVGGSQEQSFQRIKGIETNKYPERKKKYHTMKKSLHAIPERFYIGSIDNGWKARNHIPWVKMNHMPESVKDRFTKMWESLFFFVKSEKYYFNLDAVREKSLTQTTPFNVRIREAKKGAGQLKLGESPKAWKASEAELETHNSKGERKQDNTLGADGKPKANYKGFNERWQNKAQDQYTKRVLDERENGAQHDNPLGNPNGKNPGDVFFINPKPFKEAHFATFPEDLPLKILRCACPPGGFVLDPFFGAGTVGVAAEKLGLNWVGIELNPEYVKIARKRLAPYKNERLI